VIPAAIASAHHYHRLPNRMEREPDHAWRAGARRGEKTFDQIVIMTASWLIDNGITLTPPIPRRRSTAT